MKRATHELALCGVLCALGVVLLCLGGIPLALYLCPMLASLVLLVAREECRMSYVWCCFAATALLALLFGPDPECTLLYCFFGYYPLLCPMLERIRNRQLRILVKLFYFAVSLSTMYALLLFLFRLDAVVEEWNSTAPALLWATVAMGLALFALYDRLLPRLTLLYRRRKRR